MYRPCETGSCNPEKCDDVDCIGEEDEVVSIEYVNTKEEHKLNDKS